MLTAVCLNTYPLTKAQHRAYCAFVAMFDTERCYAPTQIKVSYLRFFAGKWQARVSVYVDKMFNGSETIVLTPKQVKALTQ